MAAPLSLQDALQKFEQESDGPLNEEQAHAFREGWKANEGVSLLVCRNLAKRTLESLKRQKAPCTNSRYREMVNLRQLSLLLGAKTTDPLFDFSVQLNEVLAVNAPYRIILRKEKGVWQAVTEESFCMGTSDAFANVWWSGQAHSFLGKMKVCAQTDALSHVREGDVLYDPMDPMCPVNINWEAWVIAESKYFMRNAPFTVKPSEDDDACLR